MTHTVAQATPSNGASRADDFQPQTRNPQAAEGDLQQGSNLQDTSGYDVLNNENARILVPSGSSEPSESPAPVPGGEGINWPLVVIISVLLVGVLEYVFRRRERSKAAGVPASTVYDEPVIAEAPAPQPTLPPATQPTKPRKSRKKAKRKKRR